MFKFVILLKRFIGPYKKYVVLNLLFHFLSTVFSLFSFAAIIPVLQILFGLQKADKTFVEWAWSDNMSEILSALKNNLSFTIEQTIQQVGPNMALFYLGLFLVVMTAFKTGTSYLGSYFMIPIRTGVLRDLRMQLYRKIVSLPIGFFTEERKGDIMARMTGDVGEVEASIMSSLDLMF